MSETKSVRPGEIATFPLATPLLAGRLPSPRPSSLIAFVVILANALLAWVILGKAVKVQSLFGPDGKIFTRIMGVLIADVGIALVRDGIVSVVRLLIA